jgi:hypothetical protein
MSAAAETMTYGAEREWIRALSLLLNCRLRSSRHVAGGGLRAPAMPANTQFIIDGLVLAIDDHPVAATASWKALADHLRECSGRYERLRMQLQDAASLRYGRDKIQWAVYATVQDLYLAWCAIDGAVKSSRLAELRQCAELEWPRLVASHMSLLWHPSQPSAGDGLALMDAAAEQFRRLFLDLVRSWLVLRILRPDTLRRVEEHVKQALRVVSEAADPHASHREGAAAQLIRRQLQPLSSVAGGGNANTAGPKLLDITALQLTESNRQPFACRHCGACFKSAEACSRHYRAHFYARAQLTDPMVRLRHCSREAFLAHHVSGVPDGSFVPTVAPLKDAYSVKGDAAVVVRTASTSGNGMSTAALQPSGLRKRPRNGVWLVDDPSVAVLCSVCSQPILCRLDAASGEWALVDAVDSPGGGVGVSHKGCATNP